MARKKTKCNGCNLVFPTTERWKAHLKTSPQCKEKHFPCNYCSSGFCGYNILALDKHFHFSDSCKRKHKSFVDGTIGKLPPGTEVATSSTHQKKGSNNYLFEALAPDGTMANICVEFEDTTEERMSRLRTMPRPPPDMVDGSNFMSNSKSYAGLVANGMGSHLFDYDMDVDDQSTPSFRDDNDNENSSPPFGRDTHDSCTDQGQGNTMNDNNSARTIDHEFGYSSCDIDSNDESNEECSLDVDSVTGAQSETEGHDMEGTRGETFNLPSNDLTNEQVAISDRLNNIHFHETDIIMMDLYLILRASNTPLAVFDRIVDWTKRHKHSLDESTVDSLTSRKRFIENINRTMYRNASLMKPRICVVQLNEGRETSVVTFPFRDMAMRMVSNTNLFRKENLVIDTNNLFAPPAPSMYYRDIHDGSWWMEAMRNLCADDPIKMLMPFIFFIDGLKLDKYGKLTAEAVLACCAWFNREARNRGGTWNVFGFVEDQTTFSEQEMYERSDKAQDYHLMMSQIFKEFKDIQDAGGILLDLEFDGKKTRVRAVPVIAFIIGDCKGNDLLCLRQGGHHVKMKGLCRDCNISPDDGDNTCIDQPLICQFLKKSDVTGKTEEELAEISFLSGTNCFHSLNFGGGNHNICSATPAELLHAVELGLCEYISESLDLFFTTSSIAIISKAVSTIVQNSHRQSERDLPNLSPFRNGLKSVKALKAKERFARCYAIWLALMNPSVISLLCKKNRKKKDKNEPSSKITRDFLRSYTSVIEDTLCFHRWLKKDHFLKSDFHVPEGRHDSRASNRIKHYLQSFKDNIQRAGNNLKTPKFHQMLHLCEYIIKYGPPSGFDGSRGECLGKTKIKDNAQRTNKEKSTLNFDIATRIYEEDLIDQASHTFYRNVGEWPSKYCTEQDMILSISDRSKTHPVDFETCEYAERPRFHLRCIDNVTNEENQLRVKIDWAKGNGSNPITNFSRHLVSQIASRMYLNCANHGGRISHQSDIGGYTQIKKGGKIFRAHPWYKNKGPWFDWGNFDWEDFDEPVPAQIMMFLDLTGCDIINDELDRDEHLSHHLLSEGIWAVVRPGTSPPSVCETNDDRFDSKIAKHFRISNDMYVVPISSLVSEVCVVLTSHIFGEEKEIDEEQEAITISGMDKWANQFLMNQE